MVSYLRRATGVQHHRRTEPSATNAANACSPQNQRNRAVTSTANDGRKTFTQQGSLVRSDVATASAEARSGSMSRTATRPYSIGMRSCIDYEFTSLADKTRSRGHPADTHTPVRRPRLYVIPFCWGRSALSAIGAYVAAVQSASTTTAGVPPLMVP